MTTVYKIRYWCLLFLIGLAPLHAFFITWLKSSFGNSLTITALSGWREMIAGIIGLFIIIELILAKTYRKLDRLDWNIIFFSLLAFIWLFAQRDNFTQWLLGFRFDVLPLLFLLIIRRVEWPNKDKIIKTALAIAFIVLSFGVFQALIAPQDFLTRFGYSQYHGEFKPEIAITGCQYLEHTQKFCRAIATFGGPTRYGTYLLLILGLCLPFLMKKSAWRKYTAILTALAILNIILTYSRSVWIGSLTMFVVWAICAIKEKVRSKKFKIARPAVIFSIVVFILLVGFGVYYSRYSIPDFETIFVRASSTSEHIKLLREGIKTAIEHPFGLGLGTAGPATIRFNKLLTENWYLQIAVELGIVGIIIFMTILTALSKKLLKRTRSRAEINWTKIGLFLSLAGIAVTGLFTHSFEETGSVLMLFGIIGML